MKNKHKTNKYSITRDVFIRLMKNPGAVIGLILIVSFFAIALFADVIVSYDVAIKRDMSIRLQPPSAEHICGTDHLGRDMLARIIHGSRVSLVVSFTAVTASMFMGGTIGAISGYFGGKIDEVIMRIVDIMLAIPAILLAITIVAALGPSLINLIISLSISGSAGFARIVRASVLTVRSQDFIEASRSIGARSPRIILEDIIPNAMAPIIVQYTLRIGGTILMTAGMSFLGLGAKPPMPEWGALLSTGKTFIRDHAYLTTLPGLAIMITILAFNLLGDGLRDALDPRLK